jgi:hypothetical protein
MHRVDWQKVSFVQAPAVAGFVSSVYVMTPSRFPHRQIRIHLKTLKDVLCFFEYVDFAAEESFVHSSRTFSDDADIVYIVEGRSVHIDVFWVMFLNELDLFGYCEMPQDCLQCHLELWPLYHTELVPGDLRIDHYFVSTEDYTRWLCERL